MKAAFVFAADRGGVSGEGPSDFLYGARELADEFGWEVACLSVDSLPADKFTGMLAGRMLRKLVPPRTSADWLSRTRRIVPRLAGFDVVVATATELAFGLALWKGIGILRVPVVGLMLGAVTHPMKSAIRRKISSKLVENLCIGLFSATEEIEMTRRFRIAKGGIRDCAFGVDETFWTPPSSESTRTGILAVGSDGRRDHDLLLRAAELMPEHHVEILSRVPQPARLPENVSWICGSEGIPACSLIELLPKYRKAACVVVPLKESPQPSGQSVAMQAMMCGAPVVTTKTSGWWGGDVIRDRKEVLLVHPGDKTELAAGIRASYSKASTLQGRDALIAAGWTAKGFAGRLRPLIEHAVSRSHDE